MTQREVAGLVGLASDVQIFRHESGMAIPPLLVALGFEVLFKTPITELFPGFYEAVRQSVELNLIEFERQLQQSTAKGRAADSIARKLEWICMRGEPASTE